MLETLENRVDYITVTTKINGVYLIYQENSRRVYIGSSGMPGLRAGRHIVLLRGKRHYNSTFQKLYDDNPNFYMVYYTVDTREEAYKLEQALIDYYSPSGNLINHALDVKAPNRGRIASPETREKQRQAKLGVPRSEEAKRRVSEGQIGRVQSAETRRLLSVVKKGKPQPDHIAELCRERNRLRSKPISVDGTIYESVREATRQLNVARDTIKFRVKSSSPKWKDWFYAN